MVWKKGIPMEERHSNGKRTFHGRRAFQRKSISMEKIQGGFIIEDTPELRAFIASMFAEQGRRQKEEKLERYRRLNRFVKPGQILFAGSSLMEQFPVEEPVGFKSPFMGEVFRHRTNRRIREANEAVKALAARVGGAYHDFNVALRNSGFAEHGDRDGQCNLAWFYENGIGAISIKMGKLS